ncbi:hypothetical protein QFC19_003321 [Naganishia cerealis]|uniref:Uncharacterized protein n=1 Tax=Naganishia cerealis TaxID=610337 RepID=A0ACC2W585_9TREE|nr:hypothetical protein QFC19_003321 [Naganishia cerealis]
MAEQFDSNPTPKPVEEDDWEKVGPSMASWHVSSLTLLLRQDEFEESLANGSTAVPTSVGAVTRENPSFEILKSGKGSDSGDQQKRLQEPPQTVTSGKILPTPTIRLMQRPKEARIPIAEANKPVGRSTDTWDDEEWDANRSGGTSNSKIWDEA